MALILFFDYYLKAVSDFLIVLTHLCELVALGPFEVPVHRGSGRHFLSFLTGNAAEQESFSRHGFGHGVHLRTACVAPRHFTGEPPVRQQQT